LNISNEQTAEGWLARWWRHCRCPGGRGRCDIKQIRDWPSKHLQNSSLVSWVMMLGAELHRHTLSWQSRLWWHITG